MEIEKSELEALIHFLSNLAIEQRKQYAQTVLIHKMFVDITENEMGVSRTEANDDSK